MKSVFRCVTAFLAATVLDAVAAGTFAIATRGTDAECSIALPENAAPSELYAAEELRDHVKMLTGVELPIGGGNGRKIRIAISNGFADDEFRARVDGPDVVIEGGKRGVLYGVYELLETYGGVGWFASWHTYVPKADVFKLPRNLDVRQKPAILLRQPYWRDVKGDFAARVRANGGFQGVGKKHGGTAFSFGGGLGVCHTFDRLLPAKEHFAAHPEWYCYRAKKGARVGNGRHAQLCLTNPEVLRIVTSNVLDRIRKDPGALCYGVSQNDSHEYCECEKCRAVDEEEESHAGTMVRFVNAIAEAVEREFPGKIVETLAYEYTRKPPKKTKLRHNVMPCLCTSGCDFSVPISESRHESTRKFLDDINGWGAQTKQLYIWDYTVNFRHYLHSFPNILAMQGNLKLFRDNSTIGILAQGDYTGWHADFGELRAWLMAKWMWNPDLPAKPLLDRFFKGYYGKAAPLARKAFDLVYGECAAAAANANTPPLVMYADIEREPPSEAVMEEVERLWLEAESVAESDEPVYRYNVRMSAMGAYYTVAMRFAYVGYRKGRPFIYLTRDMAAHARLVRAREAARRTLERIGEAKARGRKVILVEHWPEEWMGVLRGMANAPDPQTDRLLLPAAKLRIQMTNACEMVNIADAAGGRAIKFSNAGWHWAATFNMGGVKFDPGEKYRVRVHAKVDLTGRHSGVTAFSSGVYDKEAKKSCGDKTVAASQAKNGWAWYDVATWEPNASQYLWIASGRFDKDRFKTNPAVAALYVDQVEFSRVGADADIDARIEKFRKADGEFAIPNLSAGTEVEVEQIESEFKFGCNIFNFDQFGDERKNAEYRAAFLPGGLFNAATVPFYWGALEPEKGRPRYEREESSDPAYWKSHGKEDPAWRRPAPGPVLDFLDANGISAHGHAIIYHQFHPAWVDAKMDPEARWRLFSDHIAEIAAKYGSRLPQWDVVNESICIESTVDAPHDILKSNDVEYPRNYTLRSFQKAAKVFPAGVKKCINGVYVGDNWPAFIRKLLREGAQIDVIGHQMHIFDESQFVKVARGEEVRPNLLSWKPADQIAMFRKYDEIGLPVHISEITIPAPVTILPRDEAEALQARVLCDNYRLWFSWPSVCRISYWNLVDGMGAEILESGMLRKDMSKKPAYYALWNLVNNEWRTRTKVLAGEGGIVRFRGFKGRYRLAWKNADGKAATATVTL